MRPAEAGAKTQEDDSENKLRPAEADEQAHQGMSVNILDLVNNFRQRLDQLDRTFQKTNRKDNAAIHIAYIGAKAAKGDASSSAVEFKGWREVELAIDSGHATE